VGYYILDVALYLFMIFISKLFTKLFTFLKRDPMNLFYIRNIPVALIIGVLVYCLSGPFLIKLIVWLVCGGDIIFAIWLLFDNNS